MPSPRWRLWGWLSTLGGHGGAVAACSGGGVAESVWAGLVDP